MSVMSRLLLLAALFLGVCSNAFAWASVAFGDNLTSFIEYEAATRERAEEGALSGCRRDRLTGCKLALTFNGGAVAVAKGKTRQQAAYDTSPAKAVELAVAECRRHDRTCALVDIAWDPGTYWTAIAGTRAGAYIRVNAPSQEAAQDDVLKECRAKAPQPDECEVTPEGSLSARAYFAYAASARSFGVGFFGVAEQAKQSALKTCQDYAAQYRETCAIKQVQFNKSGEPAPTEFRRFETLAQQNASKLREMLGMPAPSAPPGPRPAEPTPMRCINPATGLPMTDLNGSCAGFDIMGNPYGMRRSP